MLQSPVALARRENESRAVVARFRTHLAGQVAAHLRARGTPVADVLRASAMPADADQQPWVEVPLPTLHRFLDRAAEAANDPLMGVHLGQDLSPTTWDVLQVCCRSASTLGAALQRIPKLLRLFNTWVEVEVTPGAEWTVTHRVPGEPLGLSRHGNELWVAAMLTQIARATGGARTPKRVWFGHPRPPNAEKVSEAFGVPAAEFGAGSSGFSLAEADAERPLVTADPVLLAVLDRLAEQTLQLQGKQRGVSALVYQALRELLSEQVPAIGRIAKSLAMSERALQRALAEEGTTFRGLIDQVRRDLAPMYRAHGLPLEEIAWRLGYTDTGSLQRAMERWTS